MHQFGSLYSLWLQAPYIGFEAVLAEGRWVGFSKEYR